MIKIQTNNAPEAVGTYSQAVVSGNLVFTAGQIAINPENNKLINAGVGEQAELVLKNLSAVLEAAGTSLDNAVKVTVFLKDMNDFAEVNAVYERHFTKKPARSTVEVSRLPKDVLVEMDVIAER